MLPLEDNAKEFLHTVFSMLPAPAEQYLCMQLEKYFAQRTGAAISCGDLDAYFRSLEGELRPIANMARMVEPYFLQE